MTQKHIKWQDVIEVEENSDPASRQKVVKALAFIESSKEGQKLFAELQEAQSHIPKDYVWGENADNQEKNAEDIKIEERMHTRKDNKKTIILVNHSNKKPLNTDTYSQIFENSLGHTARYDEKNHFMPILFPEVNLEKIPHIDKNGKKTLETTPLWETIAHETQHAIDEVKERFAGGEHFKSECREERAVNTENKLLESAMPNRQKRNGYIDMGLILNEVANDQKFKTKFPETMEGESELFIGIETVRLTV